MKAQRTITGIMLVEMIAVIALITAISIPLTILFRSVMSDIPRSQRLLAINSSVQNLLDQLRQDVEGVQETTKSLGLQLTGNNTLLIDEATGHISYEITDQKITRRQSSTKGEPPMEKSWLLPSVLINWNTWQKDGRYYALEVQTCAELIIRGRTEKRMTNSHVFFTQMTDKNDEK